MASKYWIKLYHEILDDPKMGRLPDHLWRRIIECFLMAGEMDRDGYLPPIADMAWKLRCSEEDLERDLMALAADGLRIVEHRDGLWFVVHFEERQAAVSSTERSQRFRERQRKEEYYGDAKETEAQRTSNEHATNRPIDTDTDTDTDTEEDSPSGASAPPDARQLFSALAAVCQISLETMTQEQRGALNQSEKMLRKARASPELLGEFGRWWKGHDWRGKKGELPKPHQVREEWGRFRAWLAELPPPPSNVPRKREFDLDDWWRQQLGGVLRSYAALQGSSVQTRNSTLIVCTPRAMHPDLPGRVQAALALPDGLESVAFESYERPVLSASP